MACIKKCLERTHRRAHARTHTQTTHNQYAPSTSSKLGHNYHNYSKYSDIQCRPRSHCWWSSLIWNDSTLFAISSASFGCISACKYEPPHDKTNKMSLHPAKTQISLGLRFLHGDSEDADQTTQNQYAPSTSSKLGHNYHNHSKYSDIQCRPRSHCWWSSLIWNDSTLFAISSASFGCISACKYEPPQDKNNKMSLRPAKTQISLGLRFLHADSEDADQTGRMPRMIRVFAGCTLTLLVLSCCGSYNYSNFFECLNCSNVYSVH